MAHELIRKAWRRLPTGPRRAAVHALARLAAPKPGPRPEGDLSSTPWIVAGFLSSPSGLGQAARLSARALAASGNEVLGIDLSQAFHEQADVELAPWPDGRNHRGPGRLLIVINAPYLPLALALLGKGHLRDKLVIGSWAWELPDLTPDWERGLGLVHAAITPSHFNAEAVRRAAPGLPVFVIPHPVMLDIPRRASDGHERQPGNHPFTVISVLSIASGYARKNPMALLAAFAGAFSVTPEARLRLLVSGAEHWPEGARALGEAAGKQSNVEITWGARTRADFRTWWGNPDAYLSLHRSEGFGLPLAESMAAGCPVVATGWSGNAEYMTSDNSCCVRFSLEPVRDPQGKYEAPAQLWANPDVEDAALSLRRLKDEPGFAARLGKQASIDATRLWSIDRFQAEISRI
jgi:glycosyltransferase involved in cell wall biosynthesis